MTALQLSPVSAPRPLKVSPVHATHLDRQRLDQRQKQLLTYKMIAGQMDLDRRSLQQTLESQSLDQQLDRLNRTAQRATAQGHHLKADIHRGGIHISIDNGPALRPATGHVDKATNVQTWQGLVMGLGALLVTGVVMLAVI